MIRSRSFTNSRTAKIGLHLLLFLALVSLDGCAKPDRPNDRTAAWDPTAEAARPTAESDLSRPLETGRAPGASASGASYPHSARAHADKKRRSAESESLAFARAVLEQEGSRKLDAGERERIAKALVFAEIHHDLPVALSLAIIKQESRFDPAARGPAGSIGLMQLQPATARETAHRTGLRWTSPKLLRDPEVNVRLGLAYLAELRRRFNNTEHAVGAYNIGPTKMRRLLSRRPFRRGPYLKKVYDHAEALENEYSN